MKENLEMRMKETRKQIESIETEIFKNRDNIEEMRAEQDEHRNQVKW